MQGPAEHDGGDDGAMGGDGSLVVARAAVAAEPRSPAAHAALARELFAAAHAARKAGRAAPALELAVQATAARDEVCRLLDVIPVAGALVARRDAALRQAATGGFEAELAVAAGEPAFAREAARRCLRRSEGITRREGNPHAMTGLALALQGCSTILDAPDALAASTQAARWMRAAVASEPTLPRRRALGSILLDLSGREHDAREHEAERRHRGEAVEVLRAAVETDPTHTSSKLLLFWARLLLAQSHAEAGARTRAMRVRGRAGLDLPDLMKQLRADGRQAEADALVQVMRSAMRGIPVVPAGLADPLVDRLTD